MANNEHYSHDHPSGLPEVSPELITAYNARPHPFETEYARLKAEQAALAHELVTGSHDIDPHRLEIKRAFAEGALHMFGILRAAAQAEQLRQLFNQPTDGGDGDEDQPLST